MTDAPLNFEWTRVEPLLEAALSQPATARRAWIERACADEAGLADEVWRLAQAATEEGDFLTSPWLSEDADLGEAGETVGRYELLERIGVGGMGAVWLAARADGHIASRSR